MPFSDSALASRALCDPLRLGAAPCLTGALAGAPLSTVALADSCPGAVVEGADICHSGALGAFAVAVVALSGNTCPFPVNPMPAPRGAGRPRFAREPFDETDDEEVLTLVVSALMYYAHTR